MMNKLKLWLEQTMMISFAIFVGILIEGIVYAVMGDDLADFNLTWLQLLSVILTGALCSVPTLFLFTEDDRKKSHFMLKLVLHFIGLYAIVSIFGFIFKWYVHIDGFIFITVIFFLVYAFVWAVTLWFHKRDDNKINKALDDIRDEE